MERQDKGLAYLLQYEHVAWFENGMVRILDRRIYPSVIRYVECKDYREVVQAIRDMVTQSAGPYTVWGWHWRRGRYEMQTRGSRRNF